MQSHGNPRHFANLTGIEGGVVAEGTLRAGPLALLRGAPRKGGGGERVGVTVSGGLGRVGEVAGNTGFITGCILRIRYSMGLMAQVIFKINTGFSKWHFATCEISDLFGHIVTKAPQTVYVMLELLYFNIRKFC